MYLVSGMARMQQLEVYVWRNTPHQANWYKNHAYIGLNISYLGIVEVAIRYLYVFATLRLTLGIFDNLFDSIYFGPKGLSPLEFFF